MQTVAGPLAAAFLVLAFFSAIAALRSRDKHQKVLWSLLGLVAYLVGGTASVVLIHSLQHSVPVLQWAIYILVVSGLGFWVALIGTDLAAAREGLRTLRERLRLADSLALPGWKNMDVQQFKAEDQGTASRINLVLNISAALVVMPGIAGVLVIAIAMNIQGNRTSDFVAHTVGFYSLLLATCWTVAYVLTISLVSIVQIVRGNGHQLTLSKVALRLGTWAGFGAAGGVFVGALIPLVVVPLAKSHLQVLGIALLDSISPGLLLAISASGAVAGFLLGEVISLVDIADGEQNLYLKAVVPPLGFAALTTGAGLLGLSPGRLSRELATEYNQTVLDGLNPANSDPFKAALSQGLDSQVGWASVVSGFESHGWNQMMDQHFFYSATWIVALLVALFSLTVELRRREKAILQEG